MTGPEKKIWYEILSRKTFEGYTFLRQKPLLDYIVDFYCHELALVIEIDGESHIGQETYDAQRTHKLADVGIEVLRVTNDDVLQNLE